MRNFFAVTGLMVTVALTLGACVKYVDVPLATDPRIMRGAWGGSLDATCAGGIGNAQISPDGSRLVSNGAQTVVWDFASGAKIAVLERSDGTAIQQVRWISNDQLIGTVRSTTLPFPATMVRWKAADGRVISTTPLPETASDIMIFNDGSRFALTTFDPSLRQHTLRVFNADGSVVSSALLGAFENPIVVSDDGSSLFTAQSNDTTRTSVVRIRETSTGAVLHSIDFNRVFYSGSWIGRGSSVWNYDGQAKQLVSITSSGVVTSQAFVINPGEAQTFAQLSIGPDAQRLAVRTNTETRVYALSDLSAPIKTITDTTLGSSLAWSADGTRLVFGFAERRASTLDPYDRRSLINGQLNLRCGLKALAVNDAPEVQFIESEREQLTVSMKLEATYVSDSKYAISGTATVGAQSLTVMGDAYAEVDERLLAYQPYAPGHQIALKLRDSSGVTVWNSNSPQISLPNRESGTVPLNALGLLERVSDGKRYLIDLERR